MELFKEYSPELPEFISELASTPEMKRLADVGMNCGCEYTDFTHFRDIGAYTRLEHSIGVGLIVWSFTHDKTQSAAGLLHDIATPVFAHVVDFLHGDHMTQESTENETASIILGSGSILSVLNKYGIEPSEVTDYHKYPIADNDSPRLSADRLEYTFGNMVNYGFAPASKVSELYTAIESGFNENGEPELIFSSQSLALEFAEYSLRCSKVYVCDEDRYSMQMCAELIRDAINSKVVTEADLKLTEPEFIVKLCSDELFNSRWQRYRAYSHIVPDTGDSPEARIIKAKKRYIDPYIKNKGRVSEVFPEYDNALKAFLSASQEQPIRGI